MAEAGSLQLEFTTLSHLTKDPKFARGALGSFFHPLFHPACPFPLLHANPCFWSIRSVLKPSRGFCLTSCSGTYRSMLEWRPSDNPIFPKYIVDVNSNPAQFQGERSIGGEADSFYEYLMKLWVLTGKRDKVPPSTLLVGLVTA